MGVVVFGGSNAIEINSFTASTVIGFIAHGSL